MGMRKDEIVRLTWSEVDLKKGFIYLPAKRTKTNSPRIIPIHPEVKLTLERLSRALHTDRVFLRLAERNEEKLIFLMDEAEQFKNVKTGDATESIHTYLGKLAEPSNSYVGFIIASYTLTLDDMAELLVRADVRTRIGENNFVEIPPLPSIRDVQIFLKELLAGLINREKAEEKIQNESLGVSLETYPFTAEAFEMLCEFASQDPIKTLPRNLIKAVNECAISAWDEKKPIIEPNIVNEIAPLIFG